MDNDFRSGTGSQAGKTREKVREKAAEVAGKAKEKIEGRYDEQKQRTMSEVNHLAAALRRAGDDLQGGGVASFGSTILTRVAGHLDSFGSTMEGKSVDDIVSDVERLARRNPAMFIGGAMLIGFAASRFLKSSGSRRFGFDQEYARGFDESMSRSDVRSDFFERGSEIGSMGTTGATGTGLGTTGSSIGTTGRSSGATGGGIDTTGNIGGGRAGGSGTGSSGSMGGL